MGTTGTRPHWIFGDQLGPHVLAPGPDPETDPGPDPRAPVVLIEARSVLRRRRFHRAKAHLILSAIRHRAAELGDRAVHVRADTYREGLERAVPRGGVTVRHPTSRAALGLVRSMDRVTVLPAAGFLVPPEDFARWVADRPSGRPRQEDFYRWVRREHDILMEGDEPAGGRWNLDAENREPPPRGARDLGLPRPYRPREDDIDEEVRWELDRWERDHPGAFVGRDGPRRFPATRREALAALRRFVDLRLATFGPHEDAVLAADPTMSHSLLSVPLNLGLLHPAECVDRAEDAWRRGVVPLNSAEGFIRQIAGWREYVWALYWHFGEEYRRSNALRHHAPLPGWFLELDADAVTARCLADTLARVRDTGWTHHIPRLMILGSHALQSGWDPAAVTDWFHRCFVDGHDWVMLPNVIGMSQYADGGRMTTKPYTSGGAHLHRMTDHCGSCAHRPGERTGERACPFTTGYWAFVHRHRALLRGNHRTARAVAGLDRLGDLEEVLARHRERGDTPP
ncbi:cryptochrome/photolyase family protein [Streptomyces alkaliphilus]|uniref:cryptochrome/photolyase family protein n=1 Tax=Streptomyces alkaliphilus TaxID=1472722 RepID=UPI00117C70BA|nr:cryptochrome/photolyase family protein [Streptomyces alkaliphilus]MQS09865.1 cryptochrome/photolyase family protein [Streptomyces alkaliphilus]